MSRRTPILRRLVITAMLVVAVPLVLPGAMADSLVCTAPAMTLQGAGTGAGTFEWRVESRHRCVTDANGTLTLTLDSGASYGPVSCAGVVACSLDFDGVGTGSDCLHAVAENTDSFGPKTTVGTLCWGV